jgi:hypothetical protein
VIKKTTILVLMMVVTGCASSSDLEKRASNHDKAGRYYESIGQPNAAREEYRTAKEDRDDSVNIIAILVDIFNANSKK